MLPFYYFLYTSNTCVNSFIPGGRLCRSAGLYSMSTAAPSNILFLLSALLPASLVEVIQNHVFRCDLLCATSLSRSLPISTHLIVNHPSLHRGLPNVLLIIKLGSGTPNHWSVMKTPLTTCLV